MMCVYIRWNRDAGDGVEVMKMRGREVVEEKTIISSLVHINLAGTRSHVDTSDDSVAIV